MWGASRPRCSGWRTPACTTAAEPPRRLSSGRRSRPSGRRSIAQRQDPLDQLRLGVADHGEVGEVLLGLLAEPLSLGPLNRGHAPRPDRLGPLAEPGHHLLGVEGGHDGQRRGCAPTWTA